MPVVAARLHLFGRREDDFGIDCHVTVTPPSSSAAISTAGRVTVPTNAHFLASPFLTLQEVSRTWLIVVGWCHVLAEADSDPAVHVIVEEAWAATAPYDAAVPVAGIPHGWGTVTDHPDLVRAVHNALERPRHRDPLDPAWRTATIAKAIAEHTRNSISEIRKLRYDGERNFGERLRGQGTSIHLADLVELSIAASRARDLCREATREGLWLWRTEKDAYHQHRRILDPTLSGGAATTDTDLPQWMSTLDAGVRHCRESVSQLAEEVDQLHRLLEAASTISVAKDAQAQEHFNFVATVGAVTLGLPALVLGVYGAAQPDFRQQLWIVPFIVCGIVSIGVTWHLTRERAELRPKTLTTIAVVATLAIAEIAAWVAH